MRARGVSTVTPAVAASSSATAAASRGPRSWIHGSPTCMASQPALRPKAATDGRWKPVVSNRRASAQGRRAISWRPSRAAAGASRRAGPCAVSSSVVHQPAYGWHASAIARGDAQSAPIPSGPSSHFCAGIA